MKDKLLIIGASGHGKVVADIAMKMNRWESIAFLDDDENLKTSMGIEIVGTSSDVHNYIEDWDTFVGIGNNAVREKVQEMLEAESVSIPNLIHPNAVIGEQVEMGDGTVVMAGAVINCCTKVGKGCIINTGASVDHDNVIGDYVHLSPGIHLAGSVHIGQRTWLGIGSVVSNNISIVSDCTIGAGAIVIKNITESGTYVGIPVRRIK